MGNPLWLNMLLFAIAVFLIWLMWRLGMFKKGFWKE